MNKGPLNANNVKVWENFALSFGIFFGALGQWFFTKYQHESWGPIFIMPLVPLATGIYHARKSK